MTTGEFIRARREALGLTQEELAKRVGFSGKAAISLYELDERDIKMSDIEKWANALNMDVMEFYKGRASENSITIYDEELIAVIKKYYKLPKEKQELARNLILNL